MPLWCAQGQLILLYIPCSMAFNVHNSRIYACPGDLYGLTSYYLKLIELPDKFVCINKIIYPLNYKLLLTKSQCQFWNIF